MHSAFWCCSYPYQWVSAFGVLWLYGLGSTVAIILKREKFSQDLLQRYLLLGWPNQLIEHPACLNLIQSSQQPYEIMYFPFIDEKMQVERNKRTPQGLIVGIPLFPICTLSTMPDTLIEKLFLDSRVRFQHIRNSGIEQSLVCPAEDSVSN